MARWRCFFFKHKWIPGMDPDVDQCENCPKLRRAPVRRVPNGTRACPWPECRGFVTQPVNKFKKSDEHLFPYLRKAKCSFCGKSVRWERYNINNPVWPDPMPIPEDSPEE